MQVRCALRIVVAIASLCLVSSCLSLASGGGSTEQSGGQAQVAAPEQAAEVKPAQPERAAPEQSEKMAPVKPREEVDAEKKKVDDALRQVAAEQSAKAAAAEQAAKEAASEQRQQAEAAKIKVEAEAKLDVVLKGLVKADYAVFSSSFTKEMQGAFPEKGFRSFVENSFKSKYGYKYLSREFLGEMRAGELTILLWKARFKDFKNDVLLRLDVGKVDGEMKVFRFLIQ